MNNDEYKEINFRSRIFLNGKVEHLTQVAFDAANKLMSELEPAVAQRIAFCTLAMAISNMLVRQTRGPEELNDFHRHSFETVMEILRMASVDLTTCTTLTESEPDSL